MPAIDIQDMGNSFVEHSQVIRNFTQLVGYRMRNTLCSVYGDNIKYLWGEEPVEPDISITCGKIFKRRTKVSSVPKFVAEVLSASTEQRDRTEKMDLYAKAGVEEYWLIDWRKRTVEIYLFDEDEEGNVLPTLIRTVSDKNKEDLKFVIYPNTFITYDELFDFSNLADDVRQ